MVEISNVILRTMLHKIKISLQDKTSHVIWQVTTNLDTSYASVFQEFQIIIIMLFLSWFDFVTCNLCNMIFLYVFLNVITYEDWKQK